MKTPAMPPDYIEEFASATKTLGGNLAAALGEKLS